MSYNPVANKKRMKGKRGPDLTMFSGYVFRYVIRTSKIGPKGIVIPATLLGFIIENLLSFIICRREKFRIWQHFIKEE
jgi:hypothetical protein